MSERSTLALALIVMSGLLVFMYTIEFQHYPRIRRQVPDRR